MALENEDTSTNYPEELKDEVDEDRLIDRKSFQREQFDIFKHNFREAYDADYGTEELKSSVNDVDLKKAAINLLRKLHRVEKALSGCAETKPLAAQVLSLQERLSTLLKSTEFAPTNLPLPQFDRGDMELLLGTDETHTEASNNTVSVDYEIRIAENRYPEDALQWIAESNRTFHGRTQALLRDGQQLLEECKELMSSNYSEL